MSKGELNFACHVPLNSLSFGQTAINILHEFYVKGLEPSIFPIGQIQLHSFNWMTDDFKKWIESGIQKSNKVHRKSDPVFRLWHLEESNYQVSQKQVLLTFHETNEVTEYERSWISNSDRVLVTSDYTKGVFEAGGAENVGRVNLGFDRNSFKVTNKQYFPEGVTCFGLVGKLEHRKRHLDVLRLWAKKYGNRKEYFLNCAVFNQFIQPPERQGQIINQALEGKKYFNINFNPYMDRNDAFNDFLNSNHIILGMSSAEGWGLPEFQSVGLGKHGVILNATGYKSWATDENAELVEPNGMADIYDGVFFHPGQHKNQGQCYTWLEESFYEGCAEAIARFKANKVNKAGLKIQDEFTWEKTANVILEELKNV